MPAGRPLPDAEVTRPRPAANEPEGERRRPEPVVLGDFRILNKIGTGTQGVVYRARQVSRDRLVALKVFTGDAARRCESAARFAREAALLSRLDHPGVVRCYGVGEEHGFLYFAMEYVEGTSAAALLRRTGGPLPPTAALQVAARCAAALGHAADRHVIHRDIKPNNILIGRQGDVKLTDWGLAKPTDEIQALTAARVCMGTLRYVAPEQVRDARRADRRSDVYALGGVLYELLTGRVPFAGDDWVEVHRAKEENAFPPASRLNPSVSDRCDAVLARMLAPKPADRYPDYASLIADLNELETNGNRPDWAPPDGSISVPADTTGPALRVLLVYDEADYVPLVQHALHAAGVPHELTAVEDGHHATTPVRGRGAGREAGPDVVILGLTSPTHDSVRMLTAVRGASPGGPVVCGLSTSPDGADLLRGLGLGMALWVTGFGDLEPLSRAVRSRLAAAT